MTLNRSLFRSLRFQMPFIVLAGVIPLTLLVILFATNKASKSIREDSKEGITLQVKALAESVDRWDEMNVLALQNLSKQPDIISMNPAEQKPVLVEAANTYKHLFLVATTDLNGRNVARSDNEPSKSYAYRSWFKEAKEGNSLTYQTLISSTNKKPALCLSTPIKKQEIIQGVAYLCSNLDILTQQVGAFKLGKTGYVFVIDNKGQVLAHPDVKYVSQDNLTDLSHYRYVKNVLSGQDQVSTYLDDAGVTWVYYGTRLKNGWSVIALQQEAEFLKNLRQFQNTITFASFIGVLGIAGLTWFLGDRLIKPITKLAAVAKNISLGQLNQRVKIRRDDEIGTLAESFNVMTASLQKSFQDLEDKVEQRTAELKEAKEAAESANSAKTIFLANISQELRTPLNGILGYAKVLQKDDNLMPNQLESLKIIQKSGNHLLTLINDLLDWSKIEVNKMEIKATDFNLQTFLKEVVDIVDMWAEEKGLRFRFETNGNLSIGVTGDEKRLRQVLINLLSNAVKFTNRGEVIFRVSVTNQVNGFSRENIRFSVIDTGIGMSSQQLDKIFQPFEQIGDIESRAHVTGLGLAISKQLVELMGSSLKVDTQLNKGSTFSFDLNLPVVELKQEQNNGNITQKKLGYKGQRRLILIVDDKLENRLLLQDILEPLGFNIITGNDGRDVLDLLAKFRPDLMLLDLFMPVKTGFTIIRELQDLPALKKTPVIVLSATTFEVLNKVSQYVELESFLTKPIDEDKLLDLIAKHLKLEWVYENSISALPTR